MSHPETSPQCLGLAATLEVAWRLANEQARQSAQVQAMMTRLRESVRLKPEYVRNDPLLHAYLLSLQSHDAAPQQMWNRWCADLSAASFHSVTADSQP